MQYVTVHLMHEMSMNKKHKPQCDDTTMILHRGNPSSHKDVKIYHIVANHIKFNVFVTKQRTTTKKCM